MDTLKGKIGKIHSYFPNGRQGAVIEFYNDSGQMEKATFYVNNLEDGKVTSVPINERVSLGEKVVFDAIPNKQRNSWNVSWLATTVRKAAPSDTNRRASGGTVTICKGKVVNVEPTCAIIAFLTPRGEENCAFMLGSDSQVNGVQVTKGLDDFLDRNTEVDFAARPAAAPTLFGAKRYACKWVTNAIFAENVAVPSSHEAPKPLFLGDVWVRASVLSVINERRAVVQFTHPETGRKEKALLIVNRFHPTTVDLRNVIKFRDELEITFEDHAIPMNFDGCPYFCVKAKPLSKAVKEAEKAAVAAAAAAAAAGPTPPPPPQPVKVIPKDISLSSTPSSTPPLLATPSNGVFNQPEGPKPVVNGFASPSPTPPPTLAAPLVSKPDVSTRLVLNMLRAVPLEFIWENIELLKDWLEQHPLHKTYVEELIVEKYSKMGVPNGGTQ